MMRSRPVRRWLTLAIFAVLAFGLAGCSKAPTKPHYGVTPIPHADADDIAQFIGATVASDNGGWFFTVQALADSLYRSDPVLGTPIYAVPPDTTTFSIARQGQTYFYDLAYYHSNPLVGYPVRDTAAADIENSLNMASNGLYSPVGAGPNYDVLSTFGLTSDWSMNVYGLSSANDAVQFDGFFDDSMFAAVNTTQDTSATRYRLWYLPIQYNTVYIDTVKIRKADLISNPYPIDGDFYWVLDAYLMKTNTRDINPSSNNYAAEHLIEAMLNFNGTQTATLRIVDIIDDPAWEYRYSVNLKTGAIARIN